MTRCAGVHFGDAKRLELIFSVSGRGFKTFRFANLRILGKKPDFAKKVTGTRKKHLRAGTVARKHPLTGGAEAHNGTRDGRTERRS
jgi:hypothetical protein